MTKIYGVYGIDEAVYHIKRGKAFVKCEFTNGKVDGTNDHPAKMQTSSPIAQILIENSEMFNTKIFLLETIGEPTPIHVNHADSEPNALDVEKDVPENTDAEKNADTEAKTEYPEVTTVGDAMNVLKSLGVKANMLKTKEMVFQMAEKNGVVFPNLK